MVDGFYSLPRPSRQPQTSRPPAFVIIVTDSLLCVSDCDISVTPSLSRLSCERFSAPPSHLVTTPEPSRRSNLAPTGGTHERTLATPAWDPYRFDSTPGTQADSEGGGVSPRGTSGDSERGGGDFLETTAADAATHDRIPYHPPKGNSSFPTLRPIPNPYVL